MSDPAALLDVGDLTVAFGGIVALDRLSFGVSPERICGLIGPNGAGKTTLFNVISRLYAPKSGAITFAGHDLLATPAHRIAALGIARTFQNLALWPGLTVLQNVMVGAHARSTRGFLTSALRLGTRAQERALAERAHATLRELELDSYAFVPPVALPYGTLKRIELARALAAEPRLLLLDEPASGLTHSEVDELAATIRAVARRRDLTVLLVEHHMAMVMAICDKIVLLDFGRKIAEGTPAQIRDDPAVIEAYLGVTEPGATGG